MTATAPPSTLGVLLAELGEDARLVSGPDHATELAIAGSSLVSDSGLLAQDPDIVLVVPPVASERELNRFLVHLPTGEPGQSRVVVLCSPWPTSDSVIGVTERGHALVEMRRVVDPAFIILAVARLVQVPEEAVTRRLSALQRSLTQALSEPQPAAALLARLKSRCNATAAIVDRRGQTISATGPLPMSLLIDRVSQTDAQTQRIDVDGWHCVADRVGDSSGERPASEYTGWLIVAARRQGFPDAYDMAAVHVAASLVEATQHITFVARRQERAIRAAVLEEALVLERTPRAPELAGRIASLGLSFEDELRTVVLDPARTRRAGRPRMAVDDIADRFAAALGDVGILNLASTREHSVTMLVQCSPAALQRVLVATGDSVPALHVGIGRPIHGVGDISDSFHDAQLAVQRLRRRAKGAGVLRYEEFDFATRLFSDVGTDRMAAWARDLLHPLADRTQLVDGLRAFFEHDQNIQSAADSLNLHHNSLRYRLGKVEESLGISLRDPAAFSSLFLAITATEFEEGQRPIRRDSDANLRAGVADVEAQHPGEFSDPRVDNLGVALGPER